MTPQAPIGAVPTPPPEATRPDVPAPPREVEAFSRFVQGREFDPLQQQRQVERTETDSGRLERPQAVDLIVGHRDDMAPHDPMPEPPARSRGLERLLAQRAETSEQAQRAAANARRHAPETATRDSVKRRQRASTSTLQQRRDTMAPLLELIEALRARRSQNAPVEGMKIVPPAPNPLQLSLQVWFDGADVLVKARSALGPQSQDEVRLALLSLEQMLGQRVAPAGRARVILLA